MPISTNPLKENEQRLLQAAIDHAKVAPQSAMEIRRIPYGFETNLQAYGARITDPAAKQNCEAALKALLSRGLLENVEAGGQCWKYAVTARGFAALAK